MHCYVYILYSSTSRRYYCGQTNNLELRLAEHNDPAYRSTRTTKVFAGPWQMLWACKLDTRSAALHLERAVKQRGIGRFLADAATAESRPGRD